MKKPADWGEPPIFLQVLIPGGFKSNDFASADSKGFAETFFVSAESKGLASAGRVRELHVVRVHRSAKLLAGFAIHVRLLASACQRETAPRPALGKENAQNSQCQGETTGKVM